LIRDPYRYSDTTLIIPPPLVPLLGYFDGIGTSSDLRGELAAITQDAHVAEFEKQLVESLSDAGFLENEIYHALRGIRHKEFAAQPSRPPAHSGSAYPEDPTELRQVMQGYFGAGGSREPNANLIGLAAPHASPDASWESYRDAYQLLGSEHQDRTFIILGTSHYGAPERFGLTRKNYSTPAGEARTDTSIVDFLEKRAPKAIEMEDYCHATEHSIEFQVAFLQHTCGPQVKVVPILCGPYIQSLFKGGPPEQNEGVHGFLDALGELHAREGKRLMWVLGIDMAHIGRRYGNDFTAEAHTGQMLEVAAKDRARIERVEQGDASGFWDLVQQNRDDLNWCGSAPLYTFLRAVPEARARMLRYQQWQIDPQSVVSFAALGFSL
jgi:AmmeMemoRadiSam system protein B